MHASESRAIRVKNPRGRRSLAGTRTGTVCPVFRAAHFVALPGFHPSGTRLAARDAGSPQPHTMGPPAGVSTTYGLYILFSLETRNTRRRLETTQTPEYCT